MLYCQFMWKRDVQGLLLNMVSFVTVNAFVTFGWNTKDKRTFLIFVEANNLTNLESLSKSQLVKLKNKEYSVAITA